MAGFTHSRRGTSLIHSHTSRSRRHAVVALATAAALVFTGCTDPNGGDGASAEFPKAHGPRHAVLKNNNPETVVQNPRQHLPAKVKSWDGEDVTITDTSRIIGIDRPGTITRTIYSLGLGKSIIGRDKTADFPEAKNIPLVTTKAHVLNAEKMIAAHPSVVLVDVTVGPAAVLRQLRSMGIPVVYISPERSIKGVGTTITEIGKALGIDQKDIDKLSTTPRKKLTRLLNVHRQWPMDAVLLSSLFAELTSPSLVAPALALLNWSKHSVELMSVRTLVSHRTSLL